MKNIKCWRLKCKMTRPQLAKIIGTTPGYIYEIETGRKMPSFPMIIRISNVLEVCFKELLSCPHELCEKCAKCKVKEIGNEEL